jgi:hypothetical protein
VLLLCGVTNAINATLYEQLSYNFLRDIAPITGLILLPNVMVVNPLVPANTVSEFIAYAKANPGKINMALWATGPCPMWPASYSRCWLASTWFTCHIVAHRRWRARHSDGLRTRSRSNLNQDLPKSANVTWQSPGL